jgi:hypothetical protein
MPPGYLSRDGLGVPRDRHDEGLLYPAADIAAVEAFIARYGQLAVVTAQRQFASG